MVNISYTTLHKRIGEGGATLSTPSGSAPADAACFSCAHSLFTAKSLQAIQAIFMLVLEAKTGNKGQHFSQGIVTDAQLLSL